jgi:hypothetical protein
MDIPSSAKVCYHCQKHQKLVLAYFDRISIIISIALLILAFMQFREARNDRISAEEALRQTQIVEKALRTAIKAFVENNYIIRKQYVTWGSTSEANKLFENNINSLAVFAIPDDESRTKWMDSLKKLHPKK